MVDYYTVLQVVPNASEEVIRSAYKALGKKYHPDNKNYPPKVCEEKMMEINAAYEVLSDSEKRRKYDVEYQNYVAKHQNNTFSSQREDKTNTDEYMQKDATFEDDEKQEGILQSLWRGFECMAQKNRQIVDNAYYKGLGMDNYELIQAFMKNYGYKRQGYALVLEEREMLERNQDGKLVPTSKFRLYWR